MATSVRPLVRLLLAMAFLANLVSCSSPREEEPAETFVGSRACVSCHEQEYDQWLNSRHTGMFQKVGEKPVLGNFNQQTLSHEGWNFRMYKEDGGYYIREQTPTGRETLYRIEFMLGHKRIQHYLSLRPDGSIRVTFPTWDVQGKRWIHASEIIRGVQHNARGDHLAEPVQIWNKHCWNCHTSQEDEGFDIRTASYDTTFTEPGINCEMCHGPGGAHAEQMKQTSLSRMILGLLGYKTQALSIATATRLPSGRKITDCLQCHARRIMIRKGFQVGDDYYDYYIPKLIELTPVQASAPPIWMERHRRFANEALVLQESQCYLEGGVTCVHCHDPHQVTIAQDPRYENTDQLCTQCHRQYQDRTVVAAHTHHSPEEKGSRCIECHMLLITNKTIKLLQNAEVRDHNISSIPVPEYTAKYNKPNSCNNVCHTDQNLEWVIEWMDRWYPDRSRSDPMTEVIATARRGEPEAVPALIDVLNDTSNTWMNRAKAAKFLGEFGGDDVAAALIRSLDDSNALIRAEAARSLSEVQAEEAVEPLKDRLRDGTRIVRLNAVFALIKMGLLEIEGPRAELFKKVKGEYLEFLNEFPTVYDIRVDLGTYHAVHENYMLALQEYKNAASLIPESPLAFYYMGVTYAQLGMFENSLESFEEVLKLDPDFRNTRDLMEQVRSLR